jgi:hypothetical protein
VIRTTFREMSVISPSLKDVLLVGIETGNPYNLITRPLSLSSERESVKYVSKMTTNHVFIGIEATLDTSCMYHTMDNVQHKSCVTKSCHANCHYTNCPQGLICMTS